MLTCSCFAAWQERNAARLHLAAAVGDGSVSLFSQATTRQHILQKGDAIKMEQDQQLAQYKQNAFTDPTLNYLNQNLTAKLEGLEPNITAVMPCPLCLQALSSNASAAHMTATWSCVVQEKVMR